MTEIVVTPDPGELGVFGLEARHAFGDITLNKLDEWPRYKLRKIDGLHDLPDSDEASDDGYSRHGEVPRSAFLRGKTVVYSGAIQAQSQASLRVARSNLLAACAPRSIERVDITPHPDYADGGQFFNGRCISGLVPDDVPSPWSMPTPFQRIFVVSFRLYDPRIYDAAALVYETGAIAAGASEVEVDNPGGAPVDPIIKIYGPVTNPTVTNVATGKQLVFTNITIVSSDYLEVDFANRTVKRNGVEDFRIKRDALFSDWWDAGEDGLVRGEQIIRLTGSSFTAPAKAVVSFHPALWG